METFGGGGGIFLFVGEFGWVASVPVYWMTCMLAEQHVELKEKLIKNKNMPEGDNYHQITSRGGDLVGYSYLAWCL